ncbi:hypothetical protein A8926_4844 [Saccharopolyspora spinosa]|uniref:Uncharacterized protein n=1 Tax=Saccharopolyspora spinosa TaxID=60894 RepID=A0A2N3Y1X7_SACSN|nr:cytochrome P450 [Saccharopolyspora spinosa]PKW16936.1 hypothetical protein A8926_4844 [Saccharopolyspora spinosa]
MAGNVDSERALSYPIPSTAALEPPAEWAQLRPECPVARVTLPSEDGAALTTRYADVKQVLSDPRFARQLNADGAARIPANESRRVFNSSMADRLIDDALLRRLPTLELAVATENLNRFERLAVGGLRELPVPW